MGEAGGAGPGKLPSSGSDSTNWLLVTVVGIVGVLGLGAGLWLRRRGT
jgi:LPXTG-motif cell wall-anchored protein